ncbi:hypothetical protein ACRAWG_07120 [Methylobacterium sp. P31]
MASFGVYNALIGYLLLHREVMTLLSLAFFTWRPPTAARGWAGIAPS